MWKSSATQRRQRNQRKQTKKYINPKKDSVNRIFKDNDSLLKAMFAESSFKVGLFPLEEKDVRFQADPIKNANLQEDSDRKLLYVPKY